MWPQMENRRTKILGFTLLLGGLALCGAGLWLLLSPAQYQATTRIELETDAPDINGQVSYDPYFIQTEFEIIQSPLVLSNVVESFNLNAEWSKKYGNGSPLETAKTIKLLQWRMKLEPVRNTRIVEIHFVSEDPNEAARIANAIANAYQNYRMKVRWQLMTNGIQVLTQSYQEDEEKIRVLQTNVDLLGKELAPQILQAQQETTNRIEIHEATPDQPYWEAKRNLNQMIEFHKLLAAKIASENLDSPIPKTSMIEIVDVAQPPKFPVSPNRWLGAALLAIGLFPTLGGLLLLKSSRRQSA
jgi:uncharacterized protein involved in exopolysaccharide biosynthesis